MYSMTEKATSEEKMAFFRSIHPDYYVRETGNVDSPSGYFGLVRIDDKFRNDWENEVRVIGGISSIPDGIADGVYLVQIDSSGIVWAWQSESSDVSNDEALQANYDALVKEYLAWEES